MAEQKKGVETALGLDIDLHSIIKDVLKNWWVVLVLAVSTALISYVQVNKSYSPSYTIEATYVVTAKGINNSVYDNLTTAQDTATRFAQIINSPTLKNEVAKDLGIGGVPGVIRSEIIPETNLLTLKVTSGTPQMAYKILRSVMDNYPTISEYLVGNAVLDVLMAPVIPIAPDNRLNVGNTVIKIFLATITVLVLVLAVISYLKDTIRTSADVEKKLDTRLIGSLCHEEKSKTLAAKFRKNSSALLISNAVISFRYVELMQKISIKVQNRMRQSGAKTLLVTSYLENEGKSTVAANIALSLVRNGKKVVLMDMDLRKPSQYKLFDLMGEKQKELGEVLKGRRNMSDALIHHLDNGLDMVFNTKEYPGSTEMLKTENLRGILDFLKERYDYVIIDTPPMAHVADTESIASIVDASLVVVREHMADAKRINDMLDVLNSYKGDVIGCVFNDAHSSIGSTLFGQYGYGRGYGYGKYYGKYYGRKTEDSSITGKENEQRI